MKQVFQNLDTDITSFAPICQPQVGKSQFHLGATVILRKRLQHKQHFRSMCKAAFARWVDAEIVTGVEEPAEVEESDDELAQDGAGAHDAQSVGSADSDRDM